VMNIRRISFVFHLALSGASSFGDRATARLVPRPPRPPARYALKQT
jgi:hypothetical protein